ncbi:MAG: outer membrane protein assembly factor BamE [Rhodobiaceae bacterium]|nr:outer membrane protein assembly factor BamE [Rhodobiaceae bacterium]
MTQPISRRRALKTLSMGAFVAAAGPVLGGCTHKVLYHGYVVSRESLSQIPVGSSQEQVLLTLGTPSTTSTVGGETFYYVSSQIEEKAFFRPKVTERRILAIHFDDDRKVARIAEYGLQDGEVFDFISRTTPTGGAQVNLIRQILGNAGRGTSGIL